MSSTRFARLSAAASRVLLIGVALLVATGLMLVRDVKNVHLGNANNGDAALYRAITARMASSPSLETYYAVATTEQRTRGYPLHPFVTVREPALAMLAARLGDTGAVSAFRGLALLTLATLLFRLRQNRAAWIAAAVLAVLDMALIAQPALAIWHEAWAALLVALSLACRSDKRWLASCVIGFAAALFREFSAAYLLVMTFAALSERRLPEAAGWLIATFAFAIALALHANLVAVHVVPTDRLSPGWTSFGGWRFILAMVHDTGPLTLLPFWTTAILVPIALLGWCAHSSAFTDRAALTFAAWIVAFMLIGRPDNFYWGLLFAPMLLAGSAFAPRALIDLYRSALPKQRSFSPDARQLSD